MTGAFRNGLATVLRPRKAMSIIVQGCGFMVQDQEFSCAMMVSI
jgi:hypothetical protein